MKVLRHYLNKSSISFNVLSLVSGRIKYIKIVPNKVQQPKNKKPPDMPKQSNNSGVVFTTIKNVKKNAQQNIPDAIPLKIKGNNSPAITHANGAIPIDEKIV